MKTLSIRQPWAWHILNSGKDIENRSWKTNYRGRVLIHASKGIGNVKEFDAANDFAERIAGKIYVPGVDLMMRGGIIGSVEIVDCVTSSDSPWFMGKYGFVLRDPRSHLFIPWKGQLGLFEVPDTELFDVAGAVEREFLEIPSFLRRGDD